MTSLPELPNLMRVLDEHRVSSSSWAELPQLGFSGARIYKQSGQRDASYVLKVTSAQNDWIMRATSDERCREAILANAGFPNDDYVASPALGAARDGDVFSILMHDISEYLLPNERLTGNQLEAILLGMSRLHSLTPPTESAIPWCSVEDRVTLFMPDPEKLARFRIGDDILRGWELFFGYAPSRIGTLVRSLFGDIRPLTRALRQLPSRFLHGDLKLDNIGIRPGGALSLIDWSMTMVAPAAIELGWFLAMNSRSLPATLDDTLAAYSACSGTERRFRERHDALTIVCGLLIRGWRKALDAESGEPSELEWWCDRASAAAAML